MTAWSIALRNKHVDDVVYFDFAKAFYTVSHVKLISKLQAYGTDGTLLSIITDFLTDRSQRVLLYCVLERRHLVKLLVVCRKAVS